MNEKKWYVTKSSTPYSRIWLHTETKNYLLSWALISQIEASNDFLALQFLCEFGLVQISSSESLQGHFEGMQWEKVRYIDGHLLACRITPPD